MLPTNTDKDNKLFTGRNSYLDRLEKASKSGSAAILAQSGFGRTSLLRQLAKKQGCLYIDLGRLSITPESFAVDFIGTVCFLELSDDPAELPGYQSMEKLRQLKLSKRCRDIISAVDNELQKIRPDQELLIRSAFSFPEEFASGNDKQEHGRKQHKTRSKIILDNCEELLKLNNFSQVRDAFGLFFDSIERGGSCSFILSSSNVNSMKSVLKKFTPEVLEMSSLSLEETKELFGRIAGSVDDRIVDEVHALSRGMPLVVRCIAERFGQEKTGRVQDDIGLVRYILLSELACRQSQLYCYCSSLFNDSLGRARGEALLKTILKVMSRNRPLRLTEIARLIYRSGPVTKSLLERLVEVDLISREGNMMDFANPVLKQWCRLFFSGTVFSEVPDEKALEKAGGMR